MRILQSVRQRWLAQTQTWLHDLVRFLPADVESHVICGQTENLDQFPVAHLHCRASAPLPWKVLDRLRRGLGLASTNSFLESRGHALGADLVHSHFAPQGWEDLSAVRSLGIPHVTSFYGYDVHRLPREDPAWSARYGELFATVDAILCEGPHMAKCIIELGCPEEKMRVTPLGVDLETLPYRARTWSGNGPLRVLMAAAFREKKGLPLAIEALGRIAGDVELEILLVGDATDAPGSHEEKDRIFAALHRTGLAAQTEQPGFIPYASLLERSLAFHIFLAPSLAASDGDTEGRAPVALIQMAATGIILVSSDHCDIPQVVDDGRTGFLAPEGDLPGLEARLRDAISARDTWSEVAQAARRHVADTFDASSRGRHLAEVYRSIAAAAASRTSGAG